VNRTGQPWPGELPPPLLAVRDLHELEAWLGTAQIDSSAGGAAPGAKPGATNAL
jgi:hypothetical protein